MEAPDRRSWRAHARAGAARKRGLGEVLHYFIPEEEQRSARASRPDAVASPGAAARWCMLGSPERPALCALALDIAAALAGGGPGASLLATFPRPPMLPRIAGVAWEDGQRLASDPEDLRRRLEAQPPARALLLLVEPSQLGALLETARPGAVDGLLLPVDASARGIARALSWLAAADRALGSVSIGAVLVGAAGAAEVARLGEQLTGAARRELGVEVASLGALERGPASYRALLRGRSVLELESESAAAASLRRLSAALTRAREERPQPPAPARGSRRSAG